ncbi:unnamed protein product [Alternaria alternata]
MTEAESIGEKTRRRDFTPYFDAADAGNSMDLCSSEKEGFRHALAKKDMNQKQSQNTIETMKAATTKRGTGHTERTSEPRLQGELYKPSETKVTKQQAPDALTYGKSGSESQRIAHFDLRESKQQAFEFIASPVSPEIQRRGDIYTIPDAVAPAKTASASSSVYSSDGTTEEDEIDRLSKAIAGLQTFQNLLPLSPKKAEFQRKSAVPEGLNMSKIGAGKEESNNGNELQQVPREKSLEEAQIGLLEYFNAPLEAIGTGKADAQTPQTSSSQKSFTTASTGDYERVGSQEKLRQEQNGVKKRWYRGFRKV